MKAIQLTATSTALLLCSGTAAVFALAPMPGSEVPHQFTAGSPARASEVNENFQVLTDRIMDLELQLAVLQDRTQFISIETNDIEGLSGPHVLIEGANLHVRSGSGSTDDGGSTTGLGNLVIGYNELGGLSPADRDGAHNLVLGSENAFTNIAGMVAGTNNSISGPFASVLGGSFNSATGDHATILGGGGATGNLDNIASGEYSTISGGFRNRAVGNQSSINGGSQNEASGFLSSILGGVANVTSGAGGCVSGGAGNDAQGSNSSINGGQGGVAAGVSSTLSGGLNGSVVNNFDCADCN